MIGADKMKTLWLACMVILPLSVSACDGIESPANTIEPVSASPELLVSAAPTETPVADPYELLLARFLEDACIPDGARERLSEAVHGSKDSQDWIHEYEGLGWSVKNAVFPYLGGSYTNPENANMYNIGTLYYYGDESIGFRQDKTSAFEWFKLSADEKNFGGAIWAGDMARYGDGVAADELAAFRLYKQAANIKYEAAALDRLGDCYLEGIGTLADRQMAFDSYLDSALLGYAPSLYKLSSFANDVQMDLTALYKAAAMRDYSGNYWEMAYDGLDAYSASDSKRELIEKLSDVWENGDDAAASNMQKAVNSNDYFPRSFVDALTRAVYSYSYHVFADEYGLRPNRFYADTQKIKFAPYGNWESETAEGYLDYEQCQFYEYDFDGDRTAEIGIPVNSGAGGAFMGNGFVIFKETDDGLVYFSSGPECSMRDAMRIVRHEGKVYFIINWYDDPGNAPHDVTAYTIDPSGIGHTLQIDCKDYGLRQVITQTDEEYETGYDALLSDIEQQGVEAADAFRQHLIYSPGSEEQFPFEQGDSNWWGGLERDAVMQQDVFFAANINNKGVEMLVHKGHLTTQSKYYDDFHWFQLYEDDAEFSKGVADTVFFGDFYGLHSGGNLNNLLPLGDNVVQFWTHERDGITYCVSLQKHGLLYTLKAYKVQDGEAALVSKSLFIDEARGVDISFY